jgi:phospholipid transport system transporter-binding protein
MITLPNRVDHQNATAIRDQGLKQIKEKADAVDASALQEFDSSIIAVLLAWIRLQPQLKIIGSPEKLHVLSKVYGLNDILPIQLQKNL